jgi:hypothetical protein
MPITSSASESISDLVNGFGTVGPLGRGSACSTFYRVFIASSSSFCYNLTFGLDDVGALEATAEDIRLPSSFAHAAAEMTVNSSISLKSSHVGLLLGFHLQRHYSKLVSKHSSS